MRCLYSVACLDFVWTVNVFVSSVDVLGAAELAFGFFPKMLSLNTPLKTFVLSIGKCKMRALKRFKTTPVALPTNSTVHL